MYVLTHKQFDPPADPMFVPLQVGAALHEDLGYQRDDRDLEGRQLPAPSEVLLQEEENVPGDQISEKNPTFSELTGLYWIWKNDRRSDIVGTCHYRRYLVKPREEGKGEAYLNAEDIRRILCGEENSFDLITSSLLELPGSYREGFAVDHHSKDLQCLEQVLTEKYPEDAVVFRRLVEGNHTFFGNILVAKKPLYDAYCSWLFDILFEVERRTDMTGYDGYTKRLYGFLSEFLLYVYVQARHLKVYECRVAIIGEKAETKEAKDLLAACFRKKDWQQAKESLLKCLEKKPDLLMEASDIGGELRLAMQVISTCEFQAAEDEKGHTLLDTEQDFHALICRMRDLNRAVETLWGSSGNPDKALMVEAGGKSRRQDADFGEGTDFEKGQDPVKVAQAVIQREGDIAVRIAQAVMKV
jgi:hypothetical protein